MYIYNQSSPLLPQQSRLLLLICVLAMLAGHVSASGQTPTQSSSVAPTAQKPPVDKPLGDFVPCLFTSDESLSFRQLPSSSDQHLLTSDEAGALFQKYSSYLTPYSITKDDLVGKTRDEAVALLKGDAPKTNGTASQKSSAQSYLNTVAAPIPSGAPDDISCSVSLMGWQETSDDFGRRVADQYVGLQVNIRNLSQSSEFLIHDIQVAVDTFAPAAYFARFQSVRDKLIVRSVAQRGQTEDRRNFILNTLTMLGSIAGGANAALQAAQPGTSAATNFSTAVAIFQGSFLTGYANIFPDHTLEHINHLNDMGFSASSTSKTIVPTQGAVPLVTFISEKPLEQMPFAYCGKNYYKKREKNVGLTTDPGSATYPFCQDVLSQGGSPDPAGQFVKPLRYKYWDGAALRLLESRTYVVIGGVHISENSTTASLTSIDCPVFSDGTINLAVVTEGQLACSLAGSHLDKVASLSLVSSSQTIAGTIHASPSSNGSSATVSFNSTDLNKANGTYQVNMTDLSGTAIKNSSSLKFAVREPIFKTITASGTPFTGKTVSSTADLALSISGTDMDRLATVTLVAAGTSFSASLSSVVPSLTEPGQTGTVTATFKQADLAAAKAAAAGAAITLSATSLSGKSVVVNPSSVTLQ